MAEARKQILQESRARSDACDIPGYNNCKDDDAQLWYKQCSNIQLATMSLTRHCHCLPYSLTKAGCFQGFEDTKFVLQGVHDSIIYGPSSGG